MKVGTSKIEENGYSNMDISCKIIVYGWTFAAEQFRYQFVKLGGQILALVAAELPEYWYDSNLIREEEFWKDIDFFCDKDTFIYVAYPFESKEYKEVKAKLEAIRLSEFSDFLSCEAYGRKMVIINVNCHVVPYSKYLLASKSFCEEYYIYPLGAIQDRMPVEISDVALRNCDVFIHQVVSRDNRFSEYISDEYIYPLLKENCCKLAVPNFAGGIMRYGRFCFPQIKEPNLNHPKIKYKLGVFPWQDMVVDECLFRGLGVDAILCCYRDEKLISEEEIKEGYKEFLEVFKRAEKKWDIKISDFFSKSNKRILTTLGHPGKDVLEEIGRRILRALGIVENVQFDFGFSDEYPILDCVSKALEIEKCEFIRDVSTCKGNVLCNRRMNLEEYVRQYIYWVHEYELNILFSNISHIVQGRNFIFYHPTGYVRQLLNIMKEPITDTLDDYLYGMPVVIWVDLHAKIRVQHCIDLGIRVEDIYIIETGDHRKVELSNLVYEYPKVILYGMGSDFKYLIDYESDKIAVCDKKITENSKKDGIEYITIDTLINECSEAIVYVTSTQYGTEIQEDLCRKGFPKENILLNKTCIESIDMHLSKATVVPLMQSVLWTEKYFKLG